MGFFSHPTLWKERHILEYVNDPMMANFVLLFHFLRVAIGKRLRSASWIKPCHFVLAWFIHKWKCISSLYINWNTSAMNGWHNIFTLAVWFSGFILAFVCREWSVANWWVVLLFVVAQFLSHAMIKFPFFYFYFTASLHFFNGFMSLVCDEHVKVLVFYCKMLLVVIYIDDRFLLVQLCIIRCIVNPCYG